MTRRLPSELPPVDTSDADVGTPATAAGGVDAVRSAMGYVVEQAGVVRGTRALLRVNQAGGFDCPSCAWPDPATRSFAEFCENGARAVGDEATLKRITPDFFAKWSIEELASRSDAWLNAQGRLTHPMIRRPHATHYEPLSWNEAFDLLGQTLRKLPSPDRACFYTSGRTSNEAAFLYQLFVRQYGTNNLPDCSNMCHESSGVGLNEVIGVGKGTVLLEDFDHADAIFVLGQNPGTNHPRMLSALRTAKLRGAKIVTINPIREAGLLKFAHPQHPKDLITGGVELSDIVLQVKVGGDIAALKGIMKAMLEAERAAPEQVFDHHFIAAHTRGYRALIDDLDRTEWGALCHASGLSRSELEHAAEIAIASQATIACWAMGLTQHRHGVANVQTVINFLLLRGNMGRRGAGACPVRGHSNVQGDRTMGIWEHPPAWIDRLGDVFAFQPPKHVGLDTVGAIEAMNRGDIDVFFAMGGNFLSAAPDTHYTAEGLRRCSMTAHVSTKLNRAHLVTGEQTLILPCLGRTEQDIQTGGPQFVTVENSMGVVHRSQGRLSPAAQTLLSEPAIVAGLARATLQDASSIDWESMVHSYDRIRAAIAEVIPGFEHFVDKIKHGGFMLPNGARDRQWNTATGKANFMAHPIPTLTLPAGRFWMTTIRSHDQFNTTIYAQNDRYRGIYGHRRVALMNPDDMHELGLHTGDKVSLTSHHSGALRHAPGFRAIAYDLPRGTVATYFPEANVLVPIAHFAEKSRTPASKAVEVSIEAE